jgi:ankyrin repeat protein
LIETLISAGADVNAKDVRRGRASLHIAAWYTAEQNPKVIELLLSKGADINAKDNDGKTALAYAIEGGYTEIAEILRKHGAKE